MRFKRHMDLEHGLRQLDIVPLINVVFLLLLFFMLTSSFIVQPGINVLLPKAVTGETAQSETIELVVSAQNLIYFDGKILSVQELKILLAEAARRRQSVLLKADARASLGRAVEIWDMARDQGVAQVTIATNQE